MLSSGSGISPVAHQLSCFGVGFSLCCLLGACFFASPPFSGARSVIHQLAPCCQHDVLVHCLFHNFSGCCSLAQEMTFVVLYLPYFRQWLIIHPPTLLAVLCLLTVCVEISSLLLPSSPVHFQCPTPPSVCQFSVGYLLFSLFRGGVVSLPMGLVYPRGGWGNTV
jgi:hypothetical protein